MRRVNPGSARSDPSLSPTLSNFAIPRRNHTSPRHQAASEAASEYSQNARESSTSTMQNTSIRLFPGLLPLIPGLLPLPLYVLTSVRRRIELRFARKPILFACPSLLEDARVARGVAAGELGHGKEAAMPRTLPVHVFSLPQGFASRALCGHHEILTPTQLPNARLDSSFL